MSLVSDLHYCAVDREEVEEVGENDTGEGDMSPSHNMALNRTKTNVNIGGLERLLNGIFV